MNELSIPETALVKDLPSTNRRSFIGGIATAAIGITKSNTQIEGSFRNAWLITEAVNLYAAALRVAKTLKYNGETRKVTNVPEANQYLTRTYRKGWARDEI